MNNEYHSLSSKALNPGTLITHNRRGKAATITLDDPAFALMTDFNLIRPFSTPATTLLEDINQRMIACGVRLLFIADSNEELQGLVTYNDLYGEKTLLFIQQNGGKREEITAGDLMTPLNKLEALHFSDILKSRVGDIVETIKACGRQHLLVVEDQVVEDQANGSKAVTGLFSSTQIEKKLGIKIELSPRANSFAEVERALA